MYCPYTPDRAGPRAPTRRISDPCDDGGFSLIEVVVALTVLAIVVIGLGQLLVANLGSAELARQRAEASAIVAQQDASLQHLPTQTSLSAAESYIATLYNGDVISVANGATASTTKYTVTATTGAGSVSNLVAVTLTVSWKSAMNTAITDTMISQLQVPFS